MPLNALFREPINKLRLQQAPNTFKYKDPDDAIELPAGKYRSLDKHYTILNEFPMVYGLGKGSSSKAFPNGSQVKQLRLILHSLIN